MNNSFIYILKILYYASFIMMLYVFAIKGQKKQVLSIGEYSKQNQSNPNHLRLTIGSIMILCIIIGIYAVICGQIPYSSDRGFYAHGFIQENDNSQLSLGLYWVESFLQSISHDPNVLFFTISFFCLLITLMAYCIFPDVTPDALLFTGLSYYCLYSFYLLKQAPAIALIALSIAALFNRKYILCIITLILAIQFHESAYIMIPLYLVIIGAKSKLVRITEYLFLIVVFLYFTSLNGVLIAIVNTIIPGINYQLVGYVDSMGNMVLSNSFFTALKYLPFYIITLYALVNRSKLKGRINHYDNYLMVCFFASVTCIMSGYMYWMWRFGSYCFFPMLVFASLICREDLSKRKKYFRLSVIVTLAFFTFRELGQFYFLYGGF